jgi:hypothetical protein
MYQKKDKNIYNIYIRSKINYRRLILLYITISLLVLTMLLIKRLDIII